MSFNVSDLVKSLLRRSATKPVLRSNCAKLLLTPLEDRTVPTPVVTIAALSNLTEGGGATAAFRLTRSDTTGSLSVGFMTGGTAVGSNGFMPPSGTDYTYPVAATFANGSATADVTITPSNDTTSEATETITLTLVDGVDYDITAPSSATVNLFDNDAAVVSVTKVVDATEGGGAGIFRLTRLGDLSSGLTVNVSVGGTATSGTDYTAIGSTVAFAANSATADVTVTAGSDLIYDPDETVTLAASSGTGYTVSGSGATVTVKDNIPSTFTLNSYLGAVQFEIPWSQVDPTQATQSLTPSSFNLNIAGQNFAYGTANYTTAPALLFEYGDLVGYSFALNLSGTGSQFASISVASGVATGVDAITQQTFNANVLNVGAASMTVDFNTISIPGSGMVEYTITVTLADNSTISVTVEVHAGSTKTEVRDAFVTALGGKGLTVKARDTTGLTIEGTAMKELKKVQFSNFSGAPALKNRTKDTSGNYPEYVPS